MSSVSLGLEKAERVEHHLELPDVVAGELLELPEAKRLRDRVVDASQLGDRLRVLADVDVHRDAVGAARAAGPRVGDDDRGGLRASLARVATLRVAGRDRVDEPIGEVPRRSFARLERRGDGLDDLRPDEEVALRDVVLPGATPRPRAVARCRYAARSCR